MNDAERNSIVEEFHKYRDGAKKMHPEQIQEEIERYRRKNII